MSKQKSSRGRQDNSSKKKTPSIIPDKDGIRLNKYIAHAGICSRREADVYIKSGNVTVNAKTITEMGFKVQPGDKVLFDNRPINPEAQKYVLLNKPKNYITTGVTMEDQIKWICPILNSVVHRPDLSPISSLMDRDFFK